MTKKQLIVKVSTLEDSLAKFKNVWELAEKGKKFAVPIEVLSFENASDLMKTLSPKRIELLKMLHEINYEVDIFTNIVEATLIHELERV